MKLRLMITMLLVLVLIWGCAPAPVTTPTVPPTTAPTSGPTTVPTTTPTTAPTTTPTEPGTAPTEQITDPAAGNPLANMSLNELTVYPFSQIDMAEVQNTLSTALATTAAKEDVLSFQVHWMSFDPFATEAAVRTQIAQAPVEGWLDADYYARKMVFVVCFTVDHDESKTSAADYADQLGIVTLTRDAVGAAWKIDASGCSPNTSYAASQMVISPTRLTNLELTNEFVLSGYRDEDNDQYLLYVLDATTNAVVCRSYYAAKPN